MNFKIKIVSLFFAFAFAIVFLSACLQLQQQQQSQNFNENNFLQYVQYDASFKKISNNPEKIVRRLNEIPKLKVGQSVVVNGYEITLKSLEIKDVLEVGKLKYKAVIGKFLKNAERGKRYEKISDGKFVIFEVKYKKVDEKGIELPTTTVQSPLLSLLIGFLPAGKNVHVYKLVFKVVFDGDKFVDLRKDIMDASKSFCSFDTLNAEQEEAYGKCFAIIPKESTFNYLLVSAFPSERIPLAAYPSLGLPVVAFEK